MAAVPMHGMGDKHSTKHQEPCPYTSVSSFGAAGGEFAPLPILPSAFVAIMSWIALASFESRVAHERPPAIGPPLPPEFVLKLGTSGFVWNSGIQRHESIV